MVSLPSYLNRARVPAVFGLLLALFLPLVVRNVSSEPFVYDEADYMYAASQGFFANWSDTPSIPMADFARIGFVRDGRPSMSQGIRNSNDVLFYRHFHGPLFHYLLIPVARRGLRERLVRTALLAIPAASLAVIYFGCWWIVPGWNAAFLAAMLFLSSYSVIGSTELAPHQLFTLCSLACLILLLKAVATSHTRYWYGALVAAGLAFCTLEIGLALLLTLLICCCVERARWRVDRKFAAKSLGLFLGTVLVAWPAAILRLSFIKSYAVLAFLAASRGAAWGTAGFAETWRTRFFGSPLEWLLIAAGLVMWAGAKGRNLYPVALFAVITLAATLRVLTVTPRYSLGFVPALDLLAGLALVPVLGPFRRPAGYAVAALAVGLYGDAWYRAVHRPHNPNPRSAAVLSYVHQNKLENKAILAPQADVPALHYYFPNMRLRGYFGPAPSATERAAFSDPAIIPAAEP
jgi:hypothetical protein